MTIEIQLTQGKVALIDDEDYELVSQYTWYASKCRKTWYARTNVNLNGRRATLRMHRLILPDAPTVDHRDRNGLNNQRSNLRVASLQQQSLNRQSWGRSSKYRGVGWQKQCGKWAAYIKNEGRQRHLGLFVDEIEAARAYDRAALELHGPEWAQLNLPLPPHKAT